MIEQSVGELINRLIWQKQLLRGEDADLRIGAFMGHLAVMGKKYFCAPIETTITRRRKERRKTVTKIVSILLFILCTYVL